VLDISKTLMYDYHYNVMKRHYGDKIELMYTDTGKYIKNYSHVYNILIFHSFFRFFDISCSDGRFLYGLGC